MFDFFTNIVSGKSAYSLRCDFFVPFWARPVLFVFLLDVSAQRMSFNFITACFGPNGSNRPIDRFL